MRDLPPATFEHLLRLTDATGVLEHAWYTIPRREHGYCLDDVARALVVACREPEPEPAVVELATTCLSFVRHAQSEDGRFRNRLSYERRWMDEPGTDDCWGRALWALGTAARSAPRDWLREPALLLFEASAHLQSAHRRSMAFAALGAAEVLEVDSGHEAARVLLAEAALRVGRPREDPVWRWPEPRLSYANAVLPHALLASGPPLGDDALTEAGLGLLEWLIDVETSDHHLSVTPVGGWAQGEPRPGFDQQPVEVAALAEACRRAYEVTRDDMWAARVEVAARWFLGDNDSRTALFDEATGGCCDALEPGGRNENQGAESTLALISTLQTARDLA